jgi:peptidoglycan/xylan/chitin deacetylase (PgdA/CDA1 family)
MGRTVWILGLARPWIRLRRRSPRAIIYHACLQEGSAQLRALTSNITPAHFERQIQFVSEHYSAVHARDLESPERPDRAICITFDDGYASIHSHAYPILRRFNIPFSVYLVTDSVGSESFIWVDFL